MSEHSAETELIARNVAKEEIKPVFERIEKLETNLAAQIEGLGKQYSHLKADIVEDVIMRMKPVVGEFKDKAVLEAAQKDALLFEKIFRFTPDNSDKLKKLHSTLDYAERKSENEIAWFKAIRDWLFKSAVTIAVMLVLYYSARIKEMYDSPLIQGLLR